MATNPLEHAVIEAARSAVRSGIPLTDDLYASVRELEKHDGPHISVEQFGQELMEINKRAGNTFMRQYQASLNGYGRGWPRLDFLAQFAILSEDDIIDVYNAGPKIWKVWADHLRRHGLEPTWARVIGE